MGSGTIDRGLMAYCAGPKLTIDGYICRILEK